MGRDFCQRQRRRPGTIPTDIDGVYIRTGENEVREWIGRYHPFDGESFVPGIAFKNGRAST